MNSEIFIQDVKSVYDCISKSTDIASFFKLNYHQIIPKYYFLSRPELRKIILNYSMGSGKSAAAVFLIAHFYTEIKKQKALVKYKLMDEPKYQKKIYVVGNYATIDGLKKEIIKPEFGIVNKKLIEEIKSGLKSTNPAIREEASCKEEGMMRKLEKYIQFINFQALFNRCFPTLKINNLLQKTDTLINAFQNGKLEYREEIFESMRDSILIIDEFQRMYTSQCGINTYGFVIGTIMKFSRKYNIKAVFLSGTMMNTSPCELAYLNSILSEDEFLDTSKYISQETFVNGSVAMNVLNKEYEQELIDMIKNHLIYYNQKEHNKENKSQSTQSYQKCNIEMPIKYDKSGVDDSKLHMLIVKPSDSSLPIERYIGNMPVEVNKQKVLNLYSIKLQGFQNTNYEKCLDKYSNVTDDVEDENIESAPREINPRDSVPDTKLKSTLADGIFKGKILEAETIVNYSGIGYEMVKITMNAISRGEKVVIYDDRITSFGLVQYVEILKQNGCCELGKPPTNHSQCKKCFVTYDKHGNDHQFTPIIIASIYGSISATERDRITALYNKPNNLYGELISVMFISSVAQTGVSFLNTNNLIVLNRINTISRLSQIYGRIVRTHSHDGLPVDKRYVNIYTFVVEGENEPHPTIDYNYYYIRCILNKYIQETTIRIRDQSITNDIFNNPEKITVGLTEHKLFREDLLNELRNILERIQINNTFPWEFNSLCERIRNYKYTVSFIDFSKIQTNFIKNELLSSSLVRYREYAGINKDNHRYLLCYPYNVDQKEPSKQQQNRLTFKNSELEVINVEDNVYENFYKNLKAVNDKIDKTGEQSIRMKNRCEILLSQIMKSTNQDISRFKDNKDFWDVIYHIHDEYYIDDDVNFAFNHCTKNRNRDKMAGMYLADHIVLFDGTKTPIDRKLKQYMPLTGLDRVYAINCEYNVFTGNNWFLKVVVIDREINKFAEEKISINNCFSYKTNVIKEDFKLKEIVSKKNFCFDLIEILCDRIIEYGDEDIFLSPYYYIDKNI